MVLICACVCVCACVCTRAQSCPTFRDPWTVALQAPLSIEFSMQEYWSGLPFPTREDLSDQGLNLSLLHLLHWQVDSLPLAPPGKAAYEWVYFWALYSINLCV